jgi:hypothetical protein
MTGSLSVGCPNYPVALFVAYEMQENDEIKAHHRCAKNEQNQDHSAYRLPPTSGRPWS